MNKKSKMVRVADYMMERLCLEGVKHIFMVTGRGTLFLTDAVAAHKELKSICVHHEQAAAYAAVAYAQYNGKLGACLVSTGCAGTNTITGVLNAWQDGIPCIFISGQNKLKETSRFTGIPLRTFGQQEADIISIVESITKYAVMITDPKKVVYEIEKALFLAQDGRKGPVWIDVPLDVQNMRIRTEELEHFVIEDKQSYESLSDDIEYILDSLESAKRPTLLIGSGIRSAGAIEELEKFLEKYPIPLTYTSSAPDIYGIENTYSIGSVGIMGCSRAGNFTVQNSDLLLVLGCRLSSMTTGPDLCKFAREAKIVVVDIDKVEHSKNSDKIERLIIADVKKILISLLDKKIKKVENKWLSQCLNWKSIFPICEDSFKSTSKVDLYQLANSLSEVLPENAVLITDSGLIELILPTNINFKENRRSIHPASQGSMGYALPASVGAHYSSNCPVVAVIGDGSIMMNIQEFETIHHNNIPVKVIVINNNVYSVIRKRQVELFRSRTIGTDPSNGLSCPNFKKIANSYDIPYVKIESISELDKKLKEIFEMDGPVICEIMGLDNQDYISMSHTRDSTGRIVSRPLEDQAPYLERKLFLAEMIVTPIDQ